MDGEKIDVVDEGRHRRIAAVLLLQLKRQAFAQIAGEHAARVEALHHRERLLDELERRAEQLGKAAEIAAQIAGLVGHVDEMVADQAARRIGEGEDQLLGEVIAERPLLGHVGFEIWGPRRRWRASLDRACSSRSP